MFETKCVADNYKIMLTAFAILVTNIDYHFTLASDNNIQKMSSTSKFSHQHLQIVTNFKWPTSLSPFCHKHLKVATNITVVTYESMATAVLVTASCWWLFYKDLYSSKKISCFVSWHRFSKMDSRSDVIVIRIIFV